MRPSPRIGRRLASIILLTPALGLAAPAAAAPAGLAADPILEIPLYSGVVGLRTAGLGVPEVRVFDAAGEAKAEVTGTGERPADGHWVVQLSPPGDLARLVHLKPGDRVEAEVDGKVTTVTVPTMTAQASVETDTVTGTVPPTPGVYLALHRDPLFLDGERDVSGGVFAVGAGGNFRADLSGTFDLVPGTWGEVAMQDTAANVFIMPFVVPAATLDVPNYYAAARASPTAREVILTFEDGSGGVRFRSAPAIAAGSGGFVATLFVEGRPEYGIFQPEPGDILVVTVDGTEMVREPVPWVTGTIQLADRSVSGLAPAGARIVARLAASDVEGAPTAQGQAIAGQDGHYRVSLPELNVVAETAQSQTAAYSGGGAAFLAAGRVPRASVQLYGHRLGGTIAGWGRLVAEHQPADGSAAARAEGRATSGGAFDLELFARGAPAIFKPGDRLLVTAEKGGGLDLTIPEVSATVDPAARAVSGTAPAGAAVTVRAYAADPDYFGNQQYEKPYATLVARADAAGRYQARCAAADCGTRYGVTGARVGAVDYLLEWLDAPLIGVGVTESDALAKATAGTAVTVTPVDATGQPGAPRTGLVTPALSGGLPEWSADLSDRYETPMRPGDRLRIQVGEQVEDITVPELAWKVSPLHDDVVGDGPPFTAYLAVVAARQDNRDPPFGAASGATDARGHFLARLGAFDVQAGDDAQLYLLRPGFFLVWTEKGVRDPEPEATPPPEPTAVPRRQPLYLPSLEQPAAP